jgi:hypothetical protein
MREPPEWTKPQPPVGRRGKSRGRHDQGFKFGSISGIVTDDIGEPVVGAAVRLYRRNLVAGRRVLSQVNQAATDDRGVYRMSSLLAGEYYVMLPIVPSSSPAALSTGAAARMNADATSGNLSFSAAPPGTGGRQLSADGTFLLSTNSGAGVVTPDPAARGKWRSYATQWYPSSPTAATHNRCCSRSAKNGSASTSTCSTWRRARSPVS